MADMNPADKNMGSRSRSPYHEHRRHTHHHHSRKTRSRSRSPHRESHEHHRHKHHRSRTPPPKAVALPYRAQKLSKHKYEEYKPLFQSYLDIQKNLDLDELDDREARGRWKSFVSRWNRGDLARSWYDPSMLKTAQETVSSYQRRSPKPKTRASPTYTAPQTTGREEPDSQSDDDFGPAPPTDIIKGEGGGGGRRTGPTIPRLDDLALRDELRQEDRTREGSHHRDDIRFERKQDRKAQKERLEELVPRADPGSRERQLEKKIATTSTLKEFRDAKEAGDVEVPEGDLMGDDGIDAYKRQKTEMERKKNEREIRREEIARARAAETEERLAGRRQKEAETMAYLQALAKERFG